MLVFHVGKVFCINLPNEERMVLDLNALDSNAFAIEGGQGKSSLLKLLDKIRVDLVTVSVTLLDNISTAVDGAKPAPLGAGLEVRCPCAESHGATHLPVIS
jgi:hypothetical protein